MKQAIIPAAAALALSLFAATGASAAKADQILPPLAVSASEAPNAAALSERWIDGRRQELAGEALVSDGADMIRKGQKTERKATAKLSKAAAIADEQQAAYVRLVASFGGAAVPSAVETEIKALKKAADDWKDAYERVEKAQSRVTEAQTSIANGQSSQRTGNEMIALGREKMRSAEIESHSSFFSDAAMQNVVAPVEVSETY